MRGGGCFADDIMADLFEDLNTIHSHLNIVSQQS